MGTAVWSHKSQGLRVRLVVVGREGRGAQRFLLPRTSAHPLLGSDPHGTLGP